MVGGPGQALTFPPPQVEEKEVKIENEFVIRIHCLENNKKHNFALYMAPVVRYPIVPTTTMVHRYMPEMKSHCWNSKLAYLGTGSRYF